MKSFDLVQVGKRVKKESAECCAHLNVPFSLFFGMHAIHLCFDFKTKKNAIYKTKCNFQSFNLIILHENYFNEL